MTRLHKNLWVMHAKADACHFYRTEIAVREGWGCLSNEDWSDVSSPINGVWSWEWMRPSEPQKSNNNNRKICKYKLYSLWRKSGLRKLHLITDVVCFCRIDQPARCRFSNPAFTTTSPLPALSHLIPTQASWHWTQTNDGITTNSLKFSFLRMQLEKKKNKQKNCGLRNPLRVLRTKIILLETLSSQLE